MRVCGFFYCSKRARRKILFYFLICLLFCIFASEIKSNRYGYEKYIDLHAANYIAM